MEVYNSANEALKNPWVKTAMIAGAVVGVGLIFNNKDTAAGGKQVLNPLQIDASVPTFLSHQEIQDLFTQWLADTNTPLATTDTSNWNEVFQRVGAQLFFGGADLPAGDPVFGAAGFNRTLLNTPSGLYVVIVTADLTGVEFAYLFQVVSNVGKVSTASGTTTQVATTIVPGQTLRLNYVDAIVNNNKF